MTRFLLPPQGVIENTQVEIIYEPPCYTICLHILQLPIHSETASIKTEITCGKTHIQSEAIILEGGQKLLFPLETSAEIVGMLRNSSVELKIDRYKIILPPLPQPPKKSATSPIA